MGELPKSAFIFRPPFFASFLRLDGCGFTEKLAENEGRKIGTHAANQEQKRCLD